jgi:hypothetical protein
MQAKTLMIIFGIILVAINIIGTLWAFNITFTFLSFIPNNAVVFTIANGVLAVLMLVIGLNPDTY